jgi:type IV secretory pathway TraG/TraD family ATPase VirD4
MLLALDEVAGIVRWPALPSLYSHFGGSGLILASFVQSFAQLEDAFGRRAHRRCGVPRLSRSYGAGIGEARFLEDVSRLVGDMDEPHTTVGQSRGGRSTTRSVRRRRVLDVSDLAALPTGPRGRSERRRCADNGATRAVLGATP